MLEELQKLMQFHSVSTDQAAVNNLLDYAEGRLALKGFKVERQTHNGVNSLYASVTGEPHAAVMLQGHIDVVPGGSSFTQDGDIIRGRGCFDMLFGTASFLTLIDSLDDISRYDLSILLTGDEELGGENGVKAMLDTGGYTCDICILPDAGDALGLLSVAAKGIYDLKLKVDGVSHHGSRPWEGDGAGNKLVQFLSELSEVFDTSDHDNSTFVVSQLQAGSTALNQGPSEAYAGIDIRYKDGEDFARIKQALDTLRETYNVDIITEEVGRNFSLNTESPLVKRFIEVYQSHIGTPVTLVKSHGSSDARFFDDKDMPVIMFRPDGGNAHGDGEWLSYASWQSFHQILTDYVTETAKR